MLTNFRVVILVLIFYEWRDPLQVKVLHPVMDMKWLHLISTGTSEFVDFFIIIGGFCPFD